MMRQRPPRVHLSHNEVPPKSLLNNIKFGRVAFDTKPLNMMGPPPQHIKYYAQNFNLPILLLISNLLCLLKCTMIL